MPVFRFLATIQRVTRTAAVRGGVLDQPDRLADAPRRVPGRRGGRLGQRSGSTTTCSPTRATRRDAKLEGWATLAALAVLTERVRLGLLVGANTFRNPGLTAKLATTLDHLSDGRLVLGLGGGWFEREHDAFGLDFGSGFGERLDRLDEAVGLIRRLLDGERVTHEGRFYRMHDAICEPRPVQARLPILIGGSGPTKTLRTTARDADLWNAYGSPERDRRGQRDPARALRGDRPPVRRRSSGP